VDTLPEKIGYEELFVASYDALWSCVVGCRITERVFVEGGGVFLLLDVLEVAPRRLKNQVFGVLCDLAEVRAREDVSCVCMRVSKCVCV